MLSSTLRRHASALLPAIERALSASCPLVISLSVATSALAQEPSPIVANLSLDELNRLPIKIASVTEKPVREQPGIVTVITEQDIAAVGATDLMDVLALVPGFAFGTDVASVVGTGLRGLWGYEGKILLLLDGIPVNEGLYGNILARHHYAADQIRRVEIIRGPGSAVYGGSAELAVISITTRGAEQNGGFVAVRPEIASGQPGAALSAGLGYMTGRDWNWSLGVNSEHFVGFDGTWISLGGDVVNMKRAAGVSPTMVNGAVSWKKLAFRAIYDDDAVEDPIALGLTGFTSPAFDINWRAVMVAVTYDMKPSTWVSVKPKVTFESAIPWQVTSDGRPLFRVSHRKTTVDVPAVISLDAGNHVLLGISAYRDAATALDLDANLGYPPASQYFDGSASVSYSDLAGYAQYDLDAKLAQVTVGGRYEHHGYSGGAFVPRVAITKAWRAFHAKGLYDRAFRTPNIGDVQQRLQGKSITNERTSSYQIEAGYRFGEHASTVANAYYQTIEAPIAFTALDASHHGYVNGTPISTHGTEIEGRYSRLAFNASVGYSYYHADEQLSESLGLYGSAVDGLNLGLPAHKTSFSATFHVGRRIDWNVSGAALSARQAFSSPGREVALPREFTTNARVEYRTDTVSIAFAVRNLFDETVLLGQAYNGGGAPVPLLGRNYSITLKYHIR